MREGWEKVRLGDILTYEQGAKVLALLKSNNNEGLKQYLDSIEEQLLSKGILPDYLYYAILYEAGGCNQ